MAKFLDIYFLLEFQSGGYKMYKYKPFANQLTYFIQI